MMSETTLKLISLISQVLVRYTNNPNQWIGREDKLEDLVGKKEYVKELVEKLNQEASERGYEGVFEYFEGITYGDLIDNIQNYSSNGKN